MISYLSKRKRILLIGVLIMLLTAIPYLIGYAFQGEEWRFTGFLIGAEDGNSYIAKMLTGATGEWLFRSPYSSEDQAGTIAFLPYLILGKLTGGNAQHEQLVALFHFYRILSGIIVSLAIYDFISLFIEEEDRRQLALVLILIGGGLGWILAAAGLKNFLGSIPLDFLSPESFGYLGLFGLPHLSIARAFLFWGAASYLRDRSGIKAGLLWLAMGFFQPMYIIIIWIVVGLHSLLEIIIDYLSKSEGKSRRAFQSYFLKKAILAGFISSPIVIYTAVVFVTDPYLSAWTIQNFLPSPHWLHYLIAYGLVLPFSVWGVYKLYIRSPLYGSFLACWMAVFPVLVSAPVTTQRRLAEGIWVILITGMFGYYIDKERLPVLGKVMMAFLLPTTIFLFLGAASRATQPSKPIFIPSREVNAYQALKEIAPAGSVVLSSFEVGNRLPAWSPVKVIQGHGPETVHLADWQSKIEDYFLKDIEESNCGLFFEENDIDFLFWGPLEEQEWDWSPDQKNCLSQVYNSDGYRIYKISD